MQLETFSQKISQPNYKVFSWNVAESGGNSRENKCEMKA